MSFIVFVIFMLVTTPTIIWGLCNEDKLIEAEDRAIEKIKARIKATKR